MGSDALIAMSDIDVLEKIMMAGLHPPFVPSLRMKASAPAVEDSPKKAISGLLNQRKTLSFFHRDDESQSNFLSAKPVRRPQTGMNYFALADTDFEEARLTASLP
jgi:hypothetical protein